MPPSFDTFCSEIAAPPLEKLRLQCRYLLINSDPTECNTSLTTYLKTAVDYVLTEKEIYHVCSVLALDLLRLNLFLKNFGLCMGKILSLLSVLSDVALDAPAEVQNFKTLLLVTLLLTLKVKDDPVMGPMFTDCISDDDFISTLRSLGIVKIVGQVLTQHIKASGSSHATYVLLKFHCDIIFQYLYKVVLLSDDEFDALTKSPLIPTLISDLTSNDNFNEYDVTNDDFEDEDKLVAYEEFKLLLLINEQYLMKGFTRSCLENRVFIGLLDQSEGLNTLCGFTNLLVYHLNREESSIIKILILKFLYSVFTTSFTAKLPYLNDIKILLDIILRELNDLDYLPEQPKENCILALTYLKVLNPLLVFSQLSELQPPYKLHDVVETLRNIVINCDASTYQDATSSRTQNFADLSAIVKSATKCLNISWIKKGPNASRNGTLFSTNKNMSSDSLSSVTSAASRIESLKLGASDATASTDSLSFTRVASVRASNRDDYNLHTKSHNDNLNDATKNQSMFAANNGNVFLKKSGTDSKDPFATFAATHAEDLLDLPKEYLEEKTLPPLPHETPLEKLNARQRKARIKKAPPPPPPPPRRRR